jgi:hypothetical protein
MVDRFLAWLGAGVVTAGIAATVAKAGGRGSRRQSARLRREGNDVVGPPKPKPAVEKPKKNSAAE